MNRQDYRNISPSLFLYLTASYSFSLFEDLSLLLHVPSPCALPGWWAWCRRKMVRMVPAYQGCGTGGESAPVVMLTDERLSREEYVAWRSMCTLLG